MQTLIRTCVGLLLCSQLAPLRADDNFEPLEHTTALDVVTSGAEELKGTLEALRHWTATAVLTSQFRVSDGSYRNDQDEVQQITGPVMNYRTVDITFEWDRVAENFHSTYTSRSPAKLIEIDTGLEHEVPETLRRWTLVRSGEGVYKKYPDELHGDLSGLVGRENAPTQAPGERGSPIIQQEANWDSNSAVLGQSHFDPNVLFINGSTSIVEDLFRRAGMLRRGSDRVKVSQSSDGRFVLVQMRFDSAGLQEGTIVRTTYDTDQGFLPVSILSTEDGILGEECYWQYERTGNVFYPQRYETQKFSSRGVRAGTMQEHKILDIETLTINEEIPAERLAVTVLEPAPGERLVDLSAKQVTVFQDGEFHAITDPNDRKVSTWRAGLFIASGIFILGFAIVYATYEWFLARRISTTK